MNHPVTKISAALALIISSSVAMADNDHGKSNVCPNITHDQLTQALLASVHPTLPAGTPATTSNSNGGLDFNMWATVVGTDGTVCLVTKTGSGLNDQWLLSRVISAQKANTAVGLSTNTFALSTANLYTAVQPGGSLYGLQHSNPVDTEVAYHGNSANFGATNDPLIGKRVGGVNVFGGGLALYDHNGKLVGALGVSGDTSCADHNIAWKTRENLVGGSFGSINVPAGVGSPKDNIIYTAGNGFAHPACSAVSTAIAEGF